MQTKKNDSSGRTPADIIWDAPNWVRRMMQSKAVGRVAKFGMPMIAVVAFAFFAGLYYSRPDAAQRQPAATPDSQSVANTASGVSDQTHLTMNAAPGSHQSSVDVKPSQSASGSGNAQQSAGPNSTQEIHHVEKPGVYIEAPKPRVVKRDEEFKVSLQSWSNQMSELRRLMNQRSDASVRLDNANGLVKGLELFLATAKSVQTRFDEGEANRGAPAWWNGPVAGVRAATAISAAEATAEIARLTTEIRDVEARIAKTVTEIESELAEIRDVDADALAEVKQEFTAAKTAATDIASLMAKIGDSQRTEAHQLGIIAGATEHQQAFYDIMFGMDREEAGWSRNGGERRAPAGGYTRLVNDGIVHPSREAAKVARSEIQKLQDRVVTAAETFTTSVATMRGLGRSLLASK